ncbi:MAG TPA: hypothetical protein VF867_18700 [Arthrobacter sp.]
MTVIIGLNGVARSGKDTAALHLTSAHGFTRFALADPLKEQTYELDARVNGTLSLTMLLASAGSWDKVLNHRVHGPEVARLARLYRSEVAETEFRRHNLTENDVRADLEALDPMLDGDVTFRSLLDHLDGDWDLAKDDRLYGFEVRRYLQKYGTDVCRTRFGSNAWVDHLARRIEESGAEHVAVSDVRFDNEAEWVSSQGGTVITIVRPGYGAVNGHVSEKGIDSRYVNATVHNDGSRAQLSERINDVLKVTPVLFAAA